VSIIVVVSSCIEEERTNESIKQETLILRTSTPAYSFNQLYLKTNVCQAPCWEEITPGVTKENKALKVISDGVYFDKSIYVIGNKDFSQALVSQHSSYMEGDEITVYNFERANGVIGTMYVVKEKVISIEFSIFGEYVLGEFIAAVGDPDWVMIQDDDYLIVDLFFLDEGIRCELESTDEQNWKYKPYRGVIDPDLKIYSISFHEPVRDNDLSDAVHNWIWYDSHSMRKVFKGAVHWHGYGEYQLSQDVIGE
jgi:hypothetical protein